MRETQFKDLAFGDLETELATARAHLDLVADEHLEWRPHERSWTLGALAAHLANIPYWMQTTLNARFLDLAAVPAEQAIEGVNRQKLLRLFDERCRGLLASFAGLPFAAFEEPWTLRHGEQVFFTMPRSLVLRKFGISHLAHHRAQLGLYLRLLGIPVPPAYGPTADDPTGGMP